MLREDVQMSARLNLPHFDSGALRMKDEVHGTRVSDVLTQGL